MAVITQAGASGMTVDPITSLGRADVIFLADFEGLSRRFAVLMLRFRGVDFEGVFCSPRGVGATALEGVFLALVGVVVAELVREGDPATDTLADLLMLAELVAKDRSRYA
jgi:hypothetical protein